MQQFFSVNTQRNQSLDVLRFVAVLLVIGRHLPNMNTDCSLLLRQFCDVWKRGGWIGVDLFFVLSGFLVSGLLFKDYKQNNSLSIGRFYIRRGFKIYPPFYFFLFTSIALWMITNPSHLTKAGVIGELIFLQNYLGGIWWHTWSLAIEEHFYFILPIVLFLLLKKQNNSSDDPFHGIVKISLAVCLLLLIFRILNASYRQELTHSTYLYPTHLRLDSLVIGVLVSYYYHFRRSQLENFVHGREVILAILGLVLLLPPFVFPIETTPFIYTFGLTLTYLGSACLLCASVFSNVLNLPLFRPFGYIGSHSYSIYLWHVPVIEWGVQVIVKRLFGTLIGCTEMVFAAVILCFAFGIMMAKLVEFPFLKIRDKFFPSKNQSPIPT